MKRFGLLIALVGVSLMGRAQLVVDASDTVACEGTDIVMTATGMETYAWSSTTALDTNAGDSVNATPIAGTYGVTVVGFSTSLNDTDTVSFEIVINPNPTVVIQSSASDDDNFVCFGNSATLTAISDTAVLASVDWMPSTYLNDSTGVSVVSTPDSQITYVATVTNDYGCTETGSKVVKVGYVDPEFSVSVNPDTICPGDTSNFSASGTGISRYEWSPSASLSSAVGQIIDAYPTVTTTYTVTAFRAGCVSDSDFVISVFTPPTMSIATSSSTPIKLDQSVTMTVTCPECIEYYWKFPNSSLTTTQNAQSVSPNVPGVHTIRVIGYDSNTCQSTVSASVTVEDGFIGDPFSVVDLDKNEIKVSQQNGPIVVESGSAIRAIEMYNILGENIGFYPGEGKLRNMVPTDGLSSGIYIVNVKAESAETSRKVYIQ